MPTITTPRPPPYQEFPHNYEFMFYQIHHGRKMLHETGHLPGNAFYTYAIPLHDFKPERFDHYHQTLGKLIERWENRPDRPDGPIFPNIDNGLPEIPVIPTTPMIPEPSGFAQFTIGIIFLSLCLYARRRATKAIKRCH